jgi:phosphorylcholine metabolism protein LicD
LYNKKLLQLNRAKSKKTEFIKSNLSIKRTLDEQKVYESELKRFDSSIDFIQKELLGITESERNGMVEIQIFLDTLRNVA